MAERSCVVCRRKEEKQNLQRFVWRDNAPFADPKAVLEGRGAYCCSVGDCYSEFMKQSKKWKRIFRQK